MDVMLKARRDSSTKLYSGYINKFLSYCSDHNISPQTATIAEGLDFLATLFNEGNRRYSAINTARSALSLVIILPSGLPFGQHPDVLSFMKGIHNMKPSVPKYMNTWDPDEVLKLLKLWSPAKMLSLQLLTYKTIVLLLLVSGQRPQIVQKLTIDNMELGGSTVKFELASSDLKQGRKNYNFGPLVLRKYAPDKRLCIYHYLTAYLERTKNLRGKERAIFLTTRKPFVKPSPDTVGKWVKKVLRHAGIDTYVFSAGSTRSASTSKAKRQGLNIDVIMQAAGWTRENTFIKYYNKPLQSKNNFAETVLKIRE